MQGDVLLICGYCGSCDVLVGRSDKIYCSTKCGNKARNAKFREVSREKYLLGQSRANTRRRATPLGKYEDHKHRAKQCGIVFNLTFEQWWGLWEPHYKDRGVGKLVMCRFNDQGGYEIGNVRIDTQANNNKEACETGGRSR